MGGGKKNERLAAFSFSRKVDRAGKHIEDLSQIANSWLGTDAYRLVPKSDSKTGRTVVSANISEPPPFELSLVAGDAVHALRSALDHLALELAVAVSEDGLDPGIESSSEFPIFPFEKGTERGSDLFNRVQKKTGEPAPGSGLHKLRGIDGEAVKAIEGIQPYHRGTAYAEDPLWVIHELDRIDKHRRLHLIGYAMGSVGIGAGPDGTAYLGSVQFSKMGHSGPVENGTVVADFTASADSHFQLNFTREIALSEATLPNANRLVPTLSQLRDYIRDRVIPLLSPFL